MCGDPSVIKIMHRNTSQEEPERINLEGRASVIIIKLQLCAEQRSEWKVGAQPTRRAGVVIKESCLRIGRARTAHMERYLK